MTRPGRRPGMRAGLIAALLVAGCSTIPQTAPPITASPSRRAPAPSISPSLEATRRSGLPIIAAGTFAPAGVWAVVQNYLLMSEDGGATWWASARNLPFDSSRNDARETLLDVVDARHIWALSTDELGTGVSGDMSVDKLILTLHRSVDGGRTWTDMKLAGSYPGTLQALHFVDARNGYLLITPGRYDTATSTILRTSDGGTTWRQVGSDGLLGTLLAVRGSSIWAGSQGDAGPVERRTFAMSPDAGKTWSDVVLPGVPPIGQLATFLQPPMFPGDSTGVVLVSRNDATDTTDLYRSDDAGAHWTRVSTSTATSLAPLSSTHWLRPSTTLGTIDETRDGGSTWSAIASTGLPRLRLTWISFGDERHGALMAVTGVDTLCATDAGCTAEAGLYVTDDGGLTWRRPGFWAGDGPSASTAGDRIEVVNGPRPVIVSVGTEQGSWMWLVPPDAHLLLLDEPAARAGGMEIIDADGTCDLLGVGYFDAGPITIRLDGPATGPGYSLSLSEGSSLKGPLVEGTYGGCSG